MIPVRMIAFDPPFRPEHEVLFGLQDKRGAVDGVPATTTSTFDTAVEVVSGGDREGELDFRGEHVHGRKGDRFLYLSWGVPDRAEPFVMFARAKIELAHIPAELLRSAAEGQTGLECLVAATNDKGQPVSGTVKPPVVSWRRPGDQEDRSG